MKSNLCYTMSCVLLWSYLKCNFCQTMSCKLLTVLLWLKAHTHTIPKLLMLCDLHISVCHYTGMCAELFVENIIWKAPFTILYYLLHFAVYWALTRQQSWLAPGTEYWTAFLPRTEGGKWTTNEQTIIIAPNTHTLSLSLLGRETVNLGRRKPGKDKG